MSKKIKAADQRKRFKGTAQQIRDGRPLRQDQLNYIADAFEAIAMGIDANEVFGLKKSRGEKNSDSVARERMSITLHWMATSIKSIQDGGLGLTIENASERAAEYFNYPSEGGPELIKKYWYKNKNLQSESRSHGDPDYPY